MRVIALTFCVTLAASPAAAQTHARHTAAHDSAHAIMLDDAQHVALHQLLLGRWTGLVAPHGAGHRDTLDIRFVEDSEHQQLMVRHREAVTGFEIRGDTLRWKQAMGSAACVASTRVTALLQATKTPASKPAQVDAVMACGESRSTFKLTKVGS